LVPIFQQSAKTFAPPHGFDRQEPPVTLDDCPQVILPERRVRFLDPVIALRLGNERLALDIDPQDFF
jgi:hypothetical protein